MSELHRITIDPGQNGGRPSIRDMRIRVKDVLELLESGASCEEILADYPYLEPGDITAALEYAATLESRTMLRSEQETLLRQLVTAERSVERREPFRFDRAHGSNEGDILHPGIRDLSAYEGDLHVLAIAGLITFWPGDEYVLDRPFDVSGLGLAWCDELSSATSESASR